MTCILYVDDSQTQLENVRTALGQHGHEVRTALTVDEAVLAMQDGKVELGLIDYHMPGSTGAEALLAIRTRARPDPSVRFYVYTSDNKAQAEYRKHTFHGAILRKGDTASLIAQLEPVVRLLRLNKLARR